ncbi:MAG: DUF6431 domain-containing protein [Euzebya sp.]
MLITPDQPRLADQALRAGQLTCPGGWQGQLRPWGWARQRPLHSADRVRLIRTRRGRCNACGRTHVLLPASMLPGRGYDMSVIGPALAMAADGHAHRHIAVQLHVPTDTVRGWLRRLRPAPTC